MLWGLNWPAMKFALAELPPLTFRALMLGFGGPGLLLVVRLSGHSIRIPPGHFWNLVSVAMTLIVIWMILSIYGLRLISSGNAAILAYSMPAWAALFGVWLLGERMTARRALGLAAGLGGIAAARSSGPRSWSPPRSCGATASSCRRARAGRCRRPPSPAGRSRSARSR
jgi:drug/metabolite transporter (DMT)-like permease